MTLPNPTDFALSLHTLPPGELTRHIGRELVEVTRLLAIAEASQWSSPPRTSSGTGRSGSDVSNPTADVALDGQRLRLRAEVIATERSLQEVGGRLRKARVDLLSALTPYEGGDPE